MKAFVTALNTDSYVDGVLALNSSLKDCASKYPLYVLVSSDLSKAALNRLEKNGIPVIIEKEEQTAYEISNADPSLKYWEKTLFKLQIFGLTQFEKIVMIDADMIVAANIDELFDRPDMSAVIAGKSFPGNESYEELNSGLMVIEPSPEKYEHIMRAAREFIELKLLDTFGDQNIINYAYPEWRNQTELHLPEDYNIFATTLPYYIKNLDYAYGGGNADKDIKVIHFVGAIKPWHKGYRKSTLRQRISALIRGNYNFIAFHHFKLFNKYLKKAK